MNRTLPVAVVKLSKFTLPPPVLMNSTRSSPPGPFTVTSPDRFREPPSLALNIRVFAPNGLFVASML